MDGRGENLLDNSKQSLKYHLRGYNEYSNNNKTTTTKRLGMKN